MTEWAHHIDRIVVSYVPDGWDNLRIIR